MPELLRLCCEGDTVEAVLRPHPCGKLRGRDDDSTSLPEAIPVGTEARRLAGLGRLGAL